MSSMRTALAWMLSIAGTIPSVAAATPSAGTDSFTRIGTIQDPIPKIEEYLAAFVERGDLSGSLLLARGEEVLWERSWGLANREWEIPNRVDTRFCVASITKPMTLALAVKLMEAGKLGLQDPLDKWIPDFPRGDEITVEHLLRHRAGIPHRVTNEEQEAMPLSSAQMVELARQQELLCEPGSESIYSSGGYAVLARVLELAGQDDFDALLQKHVLRPAGCEATAHADASRILPRRATSYRFARNGFQNGRLKDTAFLIGAGSVWSTPRDLFRLMTAVRTGKLGPSVQASLVRSNGLDWNGVTNGFRAFADYHAASDVSVVFAGNLTTGALDQIRTALPRLLAGEEVEAPTLPEFSPVSLGFEQLDRFSGVYQLRPGSNITVSPVNGMLKANDWLMIPTSETSFYSPQDYGEIEGVFGEDGRPTGLRWRTPGGEFELPRLAD